MASVISMDSIKTDSQDLRESINDFEVKAPTGQRSITLPENSERNNFSIYIPISIVCPRPEVPKLGTPAISFAKRTHLVQ